MWVPLLISSFLTSLVFKTTGTSTTHLQSTPTTADDSGSLSHLFSSPERYAAALNLSVAQVEKQQQLHEQRFQQLHQTLQNPNLSGREKHHMMCQHRYQHGRHPFVCQKCWSYNPICICHLPPDNKIKLPDKVKSVTLWTSHYEWGSVSNTGSVLQLMLEDTKLLMKGFHEHDALFKEELSDESAVPVVLWTDNAKIKKTDKSMIKMSLAEVLELPERISLIALEGTWRNARRMAAKMPPHCIRVALGADDILWTQELRSILAPLRRQDGGDPGNVCTAEAVVSALVGLGMEKSAGIDTLSLVKKKINLTRRYQGKQSRA